VLLAEATGADLLVLGGHGHHPLPALGSVGAQCAARASCPVVFVPDPARSR
jgi:nucleotide-binding universal stress UspA family protein